MMNKRAAIEWDKLMSGALAVIVLLVVIFGVIFLIVRNAAVPADIAKCDNNLGGKCYEDKQEGMFCINGSCTPDKPFCCRTT